MNVEFQIVYKRRKLLSTFYTEQELTVAICGKNTSNWDPNKTQANMEDHIHQRKKWKHTNKKEKYKIK
jgi:hypothetical protein